MIIVMRMGADGDELQGVIDRIEGLGFQPHISSGDERTIVGIIGNDRPLSPDDFLSLRGVEKVVPILQPYKLASRDFSPDDTVLRIGAATVGGSDVAMIAGPCSVEGRDEMFEIAGMLAAAGVTMIRGGAFKPRTSPYSFQGMGEEGLKILAEVAERHDVATVTEVMAPDEVALVAEYCDVLQIGTRNMQNYRLLEACGRQPKPVLLKRGMSATIEELLMAAEYILAQGNHKVMLCERGVRTFETTTRNSFDLNAVPVLKLMSHLPVVVDPSHATGRWDLVAPVSLGAVAAGADGLIVEVHQDPQVAVSDGGQSLKPEAFEAMLRDVATVAEAVGRKLDLRTSQSPAGDAA